MKLFVVDCVTVVESSPVFTRPLSDLKVIEGHRVTFECHVTGCPAPELTWTLDGVELSSSAEFTMARRGSACWLVIGDVLVEDEGEYAVTASNVHGTASTAARLTVTSESAATSCLSVRPSVCLMHRGACVF